MKKNIIILGGGYGGVHAAKLLNKKYKNNKEIEITLIDKLPIHTLMTELHEVAGGRVKEASVQVDLRSIFHRSKVKIVTEEATRIDMKEQVLYSEVHRYNYDYLIIGVGSEPAFFGVPGVKEYGFSLWSLQDALKIKFHIEDIFQIASKEKNDEIRKNMLTFVVAGAGFTGIEMIGELIEWKKVLCQRYNLKESEVKILLVEAMGKILNILSDDLALKAHKYLERHKVDVLKNAPITEVLSDYIRLKDGRKISTKTLIWTCGIQGNHFCNNMRLELTNKFRIKTNELMQALDKDNVYVVGDAAFVEEGESKGLPQIVEAALQTADTVAFNIIADIEKTEKKPFKSSYHGFMVSIGSHYAVANVAGMKLSGFMAMTMKHLVNLHYLFGVGGFYLVYKYILHEFFNVKERRSMFGGHLSAKSPSIWLVPLRLFLGTMWVLEGLKKFIGEETWAKASGIHKITNGIGKDSWLISGNVKMPFDWLRDATTAATETVTTADGAGGASNYPEPIFKTMPRFFKAIMKFLMPNPEVAVWFQRIVVCTEIAIGLCLVAGLFTWLVSAISAFMVSNFILSAMAGYVILWYIFASIALMAGAGKSFGLDYYVMPWLGNRLKNFLLGKPRPLYTHKTPDK